MWQHVTNHLIISNDKGLQCRKTELATHPWQHLCAKSHAQVCAGACEVLPWHMVALWHELVKACVCVHIQRQEEQRGGRRKNPLVIHMGSPLRSSHWNVWCDIINWTHFKNKSPWTCADWDSVPPANLLTIVQHSLMLHVQYPICSCQYMILTLRLAYKCRHFACMLVHHAELVLLVMPCTQCKATLLTFLKPL